MNICSQYGRVGLLGPLGAAGARCSAPLAWEGIMASCGASRVGNPGGSVVLGSAQRSMPGLDGLRAIAVLAVIAFHLQLDLAREVCLACSSP